MTPSRRAHGQISSCGSDNARIAASATSAPATSWWDRLALTPSSSARSAADIREMNAVSWRRPLSVSTRLTLGPAEDGAAPVSLARVRKVLELATARSGAPLLRSTRATSASSSVSQSLVALISRWVGGSCRNRVRVSRPAPSGTEKASSGSSSMPVASSSEPPPMSTTSSLPADQPNQRRTARKVYRASSEPESTLRSTPVSLRTRCSTAAELPASRTAEVAKAIRSSQPSLAASRLAAATVRTRLSDPALVRRPLRSSCSASRSMVLIELIGVGWAPRCASTTRRWTVFEPTSSTPSRTRARYLAGSAGSPAPVGSAPISGKSTLSKITKRAFSHDHYAERLSSRTCSRGRAR